MIKGLKKATKQTIMVAKLPVVELTCRLANFYDGNDVRDIISEAVDDCYQEDGLYITYDSHDNIFVIIASSMEFEELAQIYFPDKTDNIISRLISRNPKNYTFLGGGSFNKEELALLKEAKMKDTPEANLINKMINELMKRNISCNY